jgi:hypothetical protein
VLGVNVPSPALGVIVTDAGTAPPPGVSVTVNGVEGTLTTPVEGPDIEYPVAAGTAVNVILAGFNRPPLLVTLMVLVPTDPGVYANVVEGTPVLNVTVEGVNVPPPPLSVGVTVTMLGTEELDGK